MKKLKQLIGVVQEFNGLMARMKKEPSTENKKLVDDCLVRLKEKVDEVLA
jgi:hypothetical protein